MILTALWHTVIDLATFFVLALLLAGVVIFGAIYVVEPIMDALRTRRNRKRWESLNRARREWEADAQGRNRVGERVVRSGRAA